MTAGYLPAPQVFVDLRSLFQPGALSPAEVQRWIARQQPPGMIHDLRRTGVALALLESQWKHLLNRLADGLVMERDAEKFRISIAATAFITLDCMTSALSAHVVDCDGEHIEAEIEVATPLPEMRWARYVLASNRLGKSDCWNALLASRITYASDGGDHQSAVDADLKALVQWSVVCVIRRMQRTFDVRALRRQVRDALSLDPKLLELARRAKFERKAEFDVSSRLWNLCVRHRAQLEEAFRLAPALLPVLAEVIARDRSSTTTPAMQLLRTEIRCHGGTPADWRWLLRAPAGPVTRMLRQNMLSESGSKSGALARHFVVWATAHRGLRKGKRWRPSMWIALARTAVGAMNDEVELPDFLELSAALVSEAIGAAMHAESLGTYPAWLAQEWMPFVRWYATYRNSESSPKKLRSWKGALKRMREHGRRAVAVADTCVGEIWAFRLSHFEGTRYQAYALNAPTPVVEEALKMHHCADAFIEDCRQGKYRMFRICGVDDDRSIATLALRLDESCSAWKVADLKGPANRPVGCGVHAFAHALADAYNQQKATGKRRKSCPKEIETDKIARHQHKALRAPTSTLRVLWIDSERIVMDPYAECPGLSTLLAQFAGRRDGEASFDDLPPSIRLGIDPRYRAGFDLKDYIDTEIPDRSDISHFQDVDSSDVEGRPEALRFLGDVPALNRELMNQSVGFVLVDELDPDPAIERLIAMSLGMDSRPFHHYMAVARPIRMGRLRSSKSRRETN